MAELWTTEEVAEYLGITVQQVYESSRRGEWPGRVGKQRGRRKLYNSDLIQAGSQEPETTNDPATAILWALSGIHETLRNLERLAQAQARARLAQPPMTEEESELAKAIVEARLGHSGGALYFGPGVFSFSDNQVEEE